MKGQYASIISTIVDYRKLGRDKFRLVCFNNFYYCRLNKRIVQYKERLVCFNNFYYCRSGGIISAVKSGQYASIISTIVDGSSALFKPTLGQYASIISTIVDLKRCEQLPCWLVCFNNFYYCRCAVSASPSALASMPHNFYCCRGIAQKRQKARLVIFHNFYYCR